MYLYREAVQSVGEVQCPLAVTELLKQRAVAVFGEPQGWTEARVNSLGNIMGQIHSSVPLFLSLMLYDALLFCEIHFKM